MTAMDVDIEDLVYARPNGTELRARLYRPRGTGPFPGVVEVHGGAWTANDRMTNRDIDRPLAGSGAVVMAIDFRMPPAVRYPEPIADVNLAVRWLKRRAGALDVDPGRVGILGTSSGGHQAMLAALKPKDPRFAAQELRGGAAFDAKVAFAVVCWGVLDPLARYRMVQANGNQRLVDAHNAFWPNEEAMAEGNPQFVVERGEASDLPPTLLLQGTADDNLTPDMAARFAEAYKAAGGTVTLETFDGAPHAFVARDPTSAHADRANRLIQEFVHAQAARA